MSQSIAPGTVSSPEDIVIYIVHDASPVGETQFASFIERMIHCKTYKRHPHVQSVVYSHSEDVVPYFIAGVPFRACYHMAEFLCARGAPVFDAADHASRLTNEATVLSTQQLCLSKVWSGIRKGVVIFNS